MRALKAELGFVTPKPYDKTVGSIYNTQELT